MFDLIRQAALALIATAGFAVLFNVPRRSLLACVFTGLAGYLARVVALRLGASPVGASFLGAALVGLLGELYARRYRLPATVFVVTGFIPLVPGIAAVRAMTSFLSGDYAGGAAAASEAALLTGGIAAGIGGLGAAARALRMRQEPAESQVSLRQAQGRL